MLTEKQLHLLSLCAIEGLNWYLLAREAQRPGGLDMLLQGDISEKLPEAGEVRKVLRDGLKQSNEIQGIARERAIPAAKAGAKLSTVLDDDYPLNLRSIFNLPPFLFYIGELNADDVMAVAVVGTREPTKDGLSRATRLAGMLAQRSVTVLSGLARGIDTAAHKAALKAGGRTVAVMGTGICHVYPSENEELAKEIVARGGALVSQFWPLTRPAQYTFPRRNVTMSGMSQGTVVIEASQTSGAKMQARLALEHGKKVFLLKSLVENYEWARKYLQRGAIEVDSVDAIIGRLSPSAKVHRQMNDLVQLRLDLHSASR